MDVCRTCLGTESLTLLFEGEDIIRRSNDLFDCTGVKIEVNDGLPQMVCRACLILVNGALKLRQQSALSEATLLESGCKINATDKKETAIELEPNGDLKKDYGSEFSNDSPECLEDSGFVHDVAPKKPTIPCRPKEVNAAKDSSTSKCLEDKRIYYNRNTPINRMVTVKGDTCHVKVEIGNVVWESEIKKEKKPSFKELLSKSYKKDLKLKSERKCGFLKRKEPKKRRPVKKEIRSPKEEVTDFDSDMDYGCKSSDELISSRGRKVKDEDIGLFDHLLLKKRRTMTKEKLESFTALAVTPYDKKGPVKCKVCHKELMNFRNFLNHCKIHFAAENTCETCGKEFVNRNSMRYHQMRLHGAEKMHKCKFCDYKGVDVYQMKNHERRVHTGEKPYICNECGVSFYLRAGIVQHMRKHFAVKSIQCDRCPAMFRSRNELTTHRNKVHLMHYTYYCYLCPEKYRSISTVRKHLVRRHGVPKDQQMSIPVNKVRKNSEITEGPPPVVGWQNDVHPNTHIPSY